jgi:hypothetical protein
VITTLDNSVALSCSLAPCRANCGYRILYRIPVMNASNPYENLVREFRESKAAQVRDIRAGKVEGEAGWGYIRAAQALLESSAGIEAFAKLLGDEDKDVRTTAAAYLLPHKTTDAVRVLKESVRGRDLAAFTALAALARWERGEQGVWEEIARVAKKVKLPREQRD